MSDFDIIGLTIFAAMTARSIFGQGRSAVASCPACGSTITAGCGDYYRCDNRKCTRWCKRLDSSELKTGWAAMMILHFVSCAIIIVIMEHIWDT